MSANKFSYLELSNSIKLPELSDVLAEIIKKNANYKKKKPMAMKLSKEEETNNLKIVIEEAQIKQENPDEIMCPHQAKMGTGEACVPCQTVHYEQCKKKYHDLKKQKGLSDIYTLHAAFEFFSPLITQYKLSECDEVLSEVYDACIKRGKCSKYYIKITQSMAFLRFKQGKYQDSIKYFKEMEDVMGDSERISENLGMAYCSVNDYVNAELAYGKAINISIEKKLDESHRTTLYMALSNIFRHNNEFKKALCVLTGSLRLVYKKYKADHSLAAKSMGSIASILEEMKEHKLAKGYYRETTRIFIITCGFNTQLTSNAFYNWGNLLNKLKERKNATKVFLKSLKSYSQIDPYSIELGKITMMLMQLNNICEDEINKKKILGYCEIIEKRTLTNKLDDLAIFHRSLGQLCIAIKDFGRSIAHYNKSIGYFQDYQKVMSDKALTNKVNEMIMEMVGLVKMIGTIPKK